MLILIIILTLNSLRLTLTYFAYEIIYDAIFCYFSDNSLDYINFDADYVYDKMLNPILFFFQIWKFDVWSIIDEDNREKIKTYYLLKTK